MQISGDKSHLPINPSLQTGAKAARPTHDGNPKEGATANDSVQLSLRAKETQRARQVAEQAPEVREAKVAGLKQAVQNGTYNVKAEQIAGKMVKGSLLEKVI